MPEYRHYFAAQTAGTEFSEKAGQHPILGCAELSTERVTVHCQYIASRMGAAASRPPEWGMCPHCRNVQDTTRFTGIGWPGQVRCDACGQRTEHGDVWVRLYRQARQDRKADNPHRAILVWIAAENENMIGMSDATAHTLIIVQTPDNTFKIIETKKSASENTKVTDITPRQFHRHRRKALVGQARQNDVDKRIEKFMKEALKEGYCWHSENCRYAVNYALRNVERELILDADFREELRRAGRHAYVGAMDKALGHKDLHL